MNLPSDDEIQARFNELPPEVQGAIQSADMTSALQATRGKHGLHVDQLGALEDQALLVMLGFSNPAAFADAVEDAVGTDPTSAEAIAEELSETLFMPIRASMRTYMEERLRRGEKSAPESKGPSAIAAAPSPVPAAAAPITPLQDETIVPAPGGGKTFMPSVAKPVLHPADEALAAPAITMPSVTELSPVPAASAPGGSATKHYAADPYREPIG